MPVQSEYGSSRTFLNTQIGDSNYFVNMSWVQSIERTDNLNRQPGSGNIIGALSIERTSIDVFSFSSLLNLEQTEEDVVSERVVVIKKQDIRMGLLVNSVSGIVEVQQDLVFGIPRIADSNVSDYFDNIAISEDQLYLSISPDFIAGRLSDNTIDSEVNETILTQTNKVDQNGTNGRTAGSNQILLFQMLDEVGKLSEYVFGMSISQILQILEPQKILEIPGSPDFVYGLINWRNRPVPVIDLYKRIGFKNSKITDQTRFVVARTLTGGHIVCFPVYFDVNVKKLPLPHQKLPLESDIDMSLTKGTFKAEDYSLVIPDMDKIVFSKISNIN